MSPFKEDDESLGHCQVQIVDLPILRNKPSYYRLLKTLEDLELMPKSWNGVSEIDSMTNAKAVSQYLLSIISSDLNWLDKDNDGRDIVAAQKDEIWELASKRLAERCGRSAMPEMIRTWTIPVSGTRQELKFEIREPPLTGDNLGLKTWGTAFTIVQKLEKFGQLYFKHLLPMDFAGEATATPMLERSNTKLLELGSGTGLVGIAAAAIWGVDVLLTDLPEIRENLLFNIQRNASIIEDSSGEAHGSVLDWNDPNSLKEYETTNFDIIITTDPLYDDEHPQLVADNIKRYLKLDTKSRVLVAIPMRDAHTKSMATDFRTLMKENGLEMMHQGEEICHDDWVEDDKEAVNCLWSIWKPMCLR